MDYYGKKFEFDLQLFGTADVDLSGADAEKVYYISEDSGSWVSAEGTAEKTVIAKLTYAGEPAKPSVLEIVTGKTVKGVTAGMTVKVATFTGSTAAASKGAVTFLDSDGDALGTVTTGTDGDAIFYAEGNKVTVAATGVVNNMTVKTNGAIFTLGGENKETLVSGTITVAQNKSASIGTGSYEAAAEGGAQITVAVVTDEDETTSTTVTIDSGEVTLSQAENATAMANTSIAGTEKADSLTIGGENSVTLGGGIKLAQEADALVINPADGKTISVTGGVELGAGNDTVTIQGAGATTLLKGLHLGDGANTVTISATGKVDITGGITGGAGVDTYVLSGVASAEGKITTITINNFGDGDKLTVGSAAVTNPIPAESKKTYIVTAANNVTDQKGAVTIYMNYADLENAPAFDYQNWITKGAEAETEKRQIVFTSNGAEDGDAYVTLSRNDTAGIDVTVAEAAVGKFSTVNLGENTVTANITLGSTDMTRLPSGVKANTVTFSIGGQSVQLTGTTTTVTYTKPAQETDPKVFTVLANGMITDATGKVTVNGVAYALGTAKMQITGATTNEANTIVLPAGSTDVTVEGDTYTLTADGATLSVVTASDGRGGMTISEGSLTLKIPAKTGSAEAASEAIRVGSTAYTLTRAAATNPPLRDLTVSSTGVVSKMDVGDTFTIGANSDAYTVYAKALVKKDGSTNAFTVFSTGEALAAASTYEEGTGLTVGAATAEGESFKSYKKATLTDGLLALEEGGSNEGDVQFYGTNADVADLTPVAETTADAVHTAYNAAEYKVEKTATGFTISGGATTGTATKMNVAALGATDISFGDGLNATLVNFVTNDTAFSVSEADRAKMTITQTTAGSADEITGAVTLTLTGTDAQKLDLKTVGAKAVVGYKTGTPAATINSVAYTVLSNDAAKTLTVTKGEAADSVAVTAATEIQIGSTKYAVTTASTFVGGALETGSVTIAADKTGFTAINIPLEQNTDAMRITAGSFTNAESKTAYTSVEVVAKNGVATVLQGFGDVVGETITISDVSDTTGYTYRVATVDGANVIQRKVKDANDSTYITMKATPSGYASSIALADLTDVTQWGTDATAYTLGGTDKNELVLSDSAFGSWEAGTTTRVFNLQKDGVTVAVLRQTAAKTFTIERGAGTDAVNISIVAAKGDTGAIIRTKGFVSTDTVKANVAKISDQDVSLTLNGTQYDIPQNVGDVSVAVTEETAGNGSKLVTGSVKLTDTAGKNTVTVADGSIITIGGSTGSATITVTAAGVVSGLTAADTFSITNADGITTTYTVSADNTPTTGKTTLTATNGYDGKYVVTTANLDNITVTSTAGQSNVVTDTDGTGTVIAPVKNSKQLDVTLAEGKYVLVKVAKNGSTIDGYAAVESDATSAPNWTTRAEATDGGVIGYFQTVTDGTGKTTVTYVGDTIGMPVNLVATSIKTTANMEVTADAADIEALHIEDVAAGQKVTRNGNALIENMDYVNLKKSVLDAAANTIIISETAANVYFVITGTPGANGITTYSINSATSDDPSSGSNSYFVLSNSSTDCTITFVSKGDGIDLSDASWANIKINADKLDEAFSSATRLILNPAISAGTEAWAGEYTVESVKAGIAVEDVQGAAGESSAYIKSVAWTGGYASITGYPNAGGTAIALKDYFATAGDKTVYIEIKSAYDKGITTLTLQTPSENAPGTGTSYLAITKSGTVITADYVNGAGIPLTGLKDNTQAALQLAIDATGLTLGTDATKNQVSEIVITDDTAASKNVDYNLTGVPGGVKVTGATDGKDTVAWTNTYDFDITLDIAKLIGDGTADISAKYFPISVKQAGTPLAEVEVNGVKTYEVGAAGDSSTSGKPHFKLVYTAATHTAVITYEQNSTSIDLAGTDIVAGSTVYVDAGGKAKTIIANIDFAKANATNTGSPANFVVINLNKESDPATVVTKSGDKAADLTTNYLYQYTYAADKVVLGDLQPGGTKYFVVTTATGKNAHADMATNQSLKGVTTYTVAAGVDTVPNATDNYIIAKNVDGVITLSYHQSTTSASAINLAEGGSQITVDASGLQDDSGVANKIVTNGDDSTGNIINYAVTGLPASVTDISSKGTGDATPDYRKTFKVSTTGTEGTMTLTGVAGTVYYYVNPGTADKGVYTVKLVSKADRVELANSKGGSYTASSTDNEITNALATMNYFTVTTAADGKVSITYTESDGKAGSDTAVKLSGAGNVIVNADGENVKTITGITIADGGDADYQFTNLRGETTITKTDEGSTYTVGNYTTTYVIDGKIELSATGTGIVYYDLVRTESDTKVVTYKLGAAATTHTESNYFAVNYNAADQGKVFVSYVNVGTDDYDLDDVNKVGLGKVGIDATSLPKGVSIIDISERGKSGDCEVRYEVTGVPATAEVVDATHTLTGDTVTKALDYAFAENAEIAVYAVNDGTVTSYVKITDVTNTAGVKTGERYTFVNADQGAGSVAITKATTAGVATYTVVYAPKAGHDVVKLSGGQIALDATNVAAGSIIDVTDTTAPANYAITGAKGGVTFKGLATDGSDTVKYNTTFAWTDGTYYAAMADNIKLDAATATAVVPAAGTTYLAVTLDNANEKVSYAWMTPNEKTGVMEKPETAPTFTGRVTLTADTTAWAGFDASGFDGLGVDIVDVPTHAVITKLGGTNTATMTYNNNNDTMTVNGIVYNEGAATLADGKTANAIKVGSDGIISGIVAITTTDNGSQVKGITAATSAETIWVEGTVGATENVVTYENGAIASVEGLDAGETIYIVDKTGATYSYTTTDGLLITRTSAADGTKTVYGLTKVGDAFFDGDVNIKYATKGDAATYNTGFTWTATGATPLYVPVTGGAAANVTIDTNVASATGVSAAAGTYLLDVKLADAGNGFTMTITPKVVDGTGKIVDATGTSAYTGKVTLDMAASSAKPVILDVTGKTYVLDVDNAKAGSTFTGLGAQEDGSAPVGDTVDTAALAKGESVTINGATYMQNLDTPTVLQFQRSGSTAKDAWGLVSGTLLVTAASGTLQTYNSNTSTLAKAQTISYAAGTGTGAANDGAVVVVASTETGDAITSITGLTGGESVTVTNNGVTKTYTANADGTEITQTETTADGTVNTKTIKNVAAGTTNVVALAWASATNTITNTLDWTKDSIGYFKVVNNVAAVAAGETTISSADKDANVVAAKVTLDAKTGVATLTLAGATVNAKGGVSTAYNLAATDVVKVTLADGTLVSYNKTGTTFTTNNPAVQISGAKAGSTFTGMTKNTDQVTTSALALNDVISFNGTYVVSAAADNAVTIAGNSTPVGGVNVPRIVAGSVQVGGKYAGEDEAVKTALSSTLAVSTTVYGSDNVVSVLYKAGAKDTEAKDGVIATFTNGNPTSITGLTNGESVEVIYKSGAKYIYTATNEAGTEITCVYKEDGSATTWTRYCTTMTAGGNILDGTYANTTTTSIFNWSATKEATATSATGYFVISAADGTATVLDQTDPATSTVINAGDTNHYVSVTATKDDTTGIVTIGKIGEVVVGIDGTISDVEDGKGILKNVTLQLPANTLGTNMGTIVKATVPADRTNVPAFTATNVGDGSVIGGNLTAADVIETATGFASGDAITISDKTYTAGATGKLKIYGDGKVEDGTLKLHTRAASGLSEVTTYFVNTDMSRVSETIAYATSEKTITGAIVTIVDGDVKGLKGLYKNETVTITKTVTDKTGTATVTTTTYSVDENGLYTKTEDVNGVKTVYTGGYASETDDMYTWSWSTTGTTAKSQFDWTNTGFFLLGEKKYSGTVELAAQDTAVSINKSKEGNVYLEVKSEGNSAKGYTISKMHLIQVGSNGELNPITSTGKVTLNVTAPSAGVDFGATTVYDELTDAGRDANVVLNVTGATAGKLYAGLATGDSIAWSSAAVGDKLYVNGTAYISGAASNAVTLKKDETTGDVEVTQGTLVVGDNTTLNSSVETTGATVVVGNKGKDGVIVTYGADGHVSSVTDLEDNETVTITEKRVETIWEKNGDPDVVVTEDVAKAANEAAEKAGEAAAYLKRVVTTTIAKAYTAGAKNKDGSSDISVMVTTTVGETLTNPLTGVVTDPVAAADMKNVISRTENWTKKAVAATDDVISLTGYTTADKFTWTNNGSAVTGYFAITDNAATVEKQTAVPEISTTATYLKVVTAAASTEAAAVADQIVALTYDTTLNAWVETDFTGTVTIPATGDLNISNVANRAREAYTVNVTNAGTGKTFKGFTAKDTIATAATFYKDNYITVGTTKLVAAADGQIIANGDAEAISGTFKIDKTDVTSIVLPENAAGSSYSVAYSTTLASGDATIVVKDGAIQEIRDIASGETVTVIITDANGKVVTEEYAATAGSGADETKITKTVVDGVTTTTSTATLKASEKYSDIYGAAYTESSKTTVSKFDWGNVADGYFVPTFDSEKNTYTATIATQDSKLTIPGTAPATVYKAGDKFLKVTRTAATATENQTITAISLVELQSDGSFRDVTSNLGTGSVVAITLPSDRAITYAKAAGALYGVQLSVPATGSKITGLKAVDAIGVNAESKAEAGKAFGILSGTTLEATGMTITTATSATNVVVNGMNFVNAAANTAGLTIQANTASDTFLTKGTLTLDTSTTVVDATKTTYGTNPDSAVMIQKLVKAVAPATEDTTGDKIIVTAADLGQDSTVTVDIYGSFDATTLTSAAAQGLTLTATNTSGTVIEKYAVDYYGNITATNAAGSTKYYLAAAPTGKIILDGTIDSTFDTAALVVDATYDTATSKNKVALLDNSRTTYYAEPAGNRLLSATYTKATAEGDKDTYKIEGLTGNNVKEIDTTALTSDKVTIDSTNLTAANIKLTDATGTTAVVKLASGTMTLEAGAISGVTALTLVSGELVNASGITALTIDATTGKATVNGVAYKDAQGAVVTAVKDGESYTSQLVSGGVTVATGDDVLKLSGGSTVTVTGSVQVYATAGAVSNIYGFSKGEKVAIRTGTTTTTYEAISETNIKVTTQPDSGTATTAMATLTGSSFNLPLATYEALTTEAGDIDWASTTAKTTYRLVPAAGSTVDLSAASKQSSFSYADVGKNLYATTVTAGTNTLTVTVKEIVVDEKGALTTDADPATTAANAGRFTLTMGSLKKGTTVTLNGASTVGQPHTYTTAKDSALAVEGNGAIVNGSLVLGATALNTKVDGAVTLNGAVASGTANAVTVTNGKVTAISGLDVGESVVIGDATDNVTYTAQQRTVEGETVYEIVKTVTKAGVVDTAATATATVTKETMANEFNLAGGLAFTTAAQDVTNEVAGAGQGQFQWATASTRGVGYFLIQKASATSPAASITVADQAQKTVFTTKEDGNTYMVASLENGTLTLSAQKAKVSATGDEVTFSDAAYTGTVKLNVAKDYTGALNYDAPSDRPYNVEFTNVTKGATLTNLGAGLNGLADKVTTVSLAENESVTVNGIDYTAGAKGALTFQNGKLFAGTVKITEALANSIVTTGNEKKGTASMTVGGANFVGDDTNEVLVKVANGEITSITGLVNAGESITVTNNTTSAEYVYSVLDDDGTMIKLASDGVSLYTTIKNGGNVYVTKDTAWNTGVTFGPGGTMVVKDTTMTADSKVWSGKTVRYYRIGDSAALANGTPAELVTSATEGTPGEYYIAVSATDNKITSVTLMQVSATGELKKASTTLEKSYSGTLNIEAETALVYSAPATRSWHYSITGVTADAKITNLNEGDTVTTGDVTYQGTVTVDNVKYVSGDTATQTMEFAGGKPDAVISSGVFAMSNGAKTLTTTTGSVATGGAIYTVKYGGGKDELAVTVSNGEVTGITGLGTAAASGTVTLEKVTADGKETTTYTLKDNVITRTYANTAGKEITDTATNTATFDLIGGTYNEDAKLKDVAYNFTWTDAGTTGYFKVANLTKATTVKTAKGTIKTTDTASNYLAVKLKGATATLAEIDSIQIQRMTLADNAGMQEVDGLVYTGDITLTVPKGIALTFDRSGLGESMENAEFAVTGIAAGSVIKNLKTGETVTTGALAEDEVVIVNSNALQAGARNATLKVTSLDAANVLVTGGKVKLVAGNDNGYAEEITVAKDKNTTAIVGVTTGTIVVNATASSFTVEGLGVGEEFTVTEGSTTVSYKVSESTILRVKDGVTSVYKMSAATIAKGTASIGSTVLAKEANWLASTAYGSDAHMATTARAKIDLKAADTALTKAEKAGTMMPDYYFVTDEAIDQKTAQTRNGAIAATMVETTGKQSWERNIGAVTTDEDVSGDGIKDRTYTASDTVGQNIIAASGWSVTGGSGDDTMTGAASGSDTLVGGSGNDSMVGGGANDYFVHTGGKDTITKYTSGKDTVKFESGFATDAVTLGKSDVTLGSSDSDMLVLIGAAASQANGVTIKNGDAADDSDVATYYFGKSTAAANFTKLTDGAYYYGQTGQKNKITVSTDKTKATKTSLGESQRVDLSDTARYHNITEVNAAGSANKVYLQANDAATTDTTTLRGGSYMTTLVGGQGHDTMFGGSGNDFFQFNQYSGTDVVSKYDGKKDTLYVAGGLGYWEISSDNKHLYLKSSASDSASIKVENVVGGTAVNIAADAEGNNVTSYFFGKSKAANTYTGTDDASKGATQHKDVFFVNELANSTTVKLFGVNDEIRIEVSKNYTLSDVMNMLDSKSNATNSIYNIEGQKLTISDKSYSMSTSNTEVTMDGTTMTIKRTK